MANEEGGIAQLVERLLCKQDVSGSNPLTSTTSDKKFSTVIFCQDEDAGLFKVQRRTLKTA